MLAWLTPDLDDFLDSQTERSIVLPGSLFYLVTGALQQLAEAENWEQFGDASPEVTSQYFADVLEEYLVSDFRNVGMISAFINPGTALPFGWISMGGQAIAQADYPELTAVVPASWKVGANIQLPNMTGGHGVAHGSTQFGSPNYAVGTQYGSFQHTLTIGEMPAHNHTTLGINIRSAGTGANLNESVGVGASGFTGGGNPHNNMPPFLAVRMCIYAGR